MRTILTEQASCQRWQFHFLKMLLASLLLAWLLFSETNKALSQTKNNFGLNLIKTTCLDCHSGANSEGELDLSVILQHRPLVENLTVWRNIAQRIQLGDMPPPDEVVLEAADKQKFENWFQTSIEHFDYSSVIQPGYTPPRRLTHSEYRHTIRDLIGVDLADTAKFPQDLSGSSGFKNSANTLLLQGSLFEKYSQSAEAIMATVFAENASPLMELAKAQILKSGKTHKNTKDRATAILTAFSRRAFRRPATTEEISGLQQIFLDEFSDSQQFEHAIQKTLTAVLVMPQFLLKIGELKDLKILNIENSNLPSLSFLKGLDNLEKLSLIKNQLKDILFISEIESLRSLDISYNLIENLSPLYSLNLLQSFKADENPIKNCPLENSIHPIQTFCKKRLIP